MKDTDIAYVAAFLDGEGCLSFSKTRKIYPEVFFCNTDKEVLAYIKGVIGCGSLYTQSRQASSKKERYVLTIRRKADIQKTLGMILPYLRIKKQKAIELLEMIGGKN